MTYHAVQKSRISRRVLSAEFLEIHRLGCQRGCQTSCQPQLQTFGFVGGWGGAVIANRMSGPSLRLAFGAFLVCLGCSLIYGALSRLGWV